MQSERSESSAQDSLAQVVGEPLVRLLNRAARLPMETIQTLVQSSPILDDLFRRLQHWAEENSFVYAFVGYDDRQNEAMRTFSVYFDFQHSPGEAYCLPDPSQFPIPFVPILYDEEIPSPLLGDEFTLTPEEDLRLAGVIASHQDVLCVPNATLIAPSKMHIRNGQSLSELCVRVGVWAKHIIPLGCWILPCEIDGIPVDVVQMYPMVRDANNADAGTIHQTHIEADPFETSGTPYSVQVCRQQQKQVYAGAMIHHRGQCPGTEDVGTLGCVVYRGTEAFGVTCSHVIPRPRRVVYSPDSSHHIGVACHVALLRPPRFYQLPELEVQDASTQAADSLYLDVGLIRLSKYATSEYPPLKDNDWKSVRVDPTTLLRPVMLHDPSRCSFAPGDIVLKLGQATGLTRGIIETCYGQQSSPSNMFNILLEKKRANLHFSHCVIVRGVYIDKSDRSLDIAGNFTNKGDCGSVYVKIVDGRLYPVAIHQVRSKGISGGMPFQQIQQSFGWNFTPPSFLDQSRQNEQGKEHAKLAQQEEMEADFQY